MRTFNIYVYFGIKERALKCDVEFESAQIMRIRVHGEKRTLLLQNDWPLQQHSKGRAIHWKIIEGHMDNPGIEAARFLTNIFDALERELKKG